MEKSEKIYIAGHRGMVGAAISRHLQAEGYANLVSRTHKELDLCEEHAVQNFFKETRPNVVVVAAAKVGGILANYEKPVEFLLQNLKIQNNLISAAHESGVRKLLFLGSSCIYPKFAPQPIPENSLLTGELEMTNEPYALAKIAGIKLCQAYARQHGSNFTSAMPTNLYGPNDNFDLHTSHVLPALIRKVHEAKLSGAPSITLWGSGSPRREFLHVDDLADACVFLLKHYDKPDIINLGCGEDITIKDLALLISDVLGYKGSLEFDTSKPDGTPRKLLDVSKLTALGWKAKIGLREGIQNAYAWYLDSIKKAAAPQS
ncbi:MAG: GDP-L-fucose synthase [Chthoniobacterales bacterium]